MHTPSLHLVSLCRSDDAADHLYFTCMSNREFKSPEVLIWTLFKYNFLFRYNWTCSTNFRLDMPSYDCFKSDVMKKAELSMNVSKMSIPAVWLHKDAQEFLFTLTVEKDGQHSVATQSIRLIQDTEHILRCVRIFHLWTPLSALVSLKVHYGT